MNTKQIALEMGVNKIDVTSMLTLVVQSIASTATLKEAFMAMSEQDQVDTVAAVMSGEIKKFESFFVEMLTRQDKELAFKEYMYHQVKSAA